MTTKSMVVLETEIKTNESKLSQMRDSKTWLRKYYTHCLYDIDAVGYTLNFKCMYGTFQTDTHTHTQREASGMAERENTNG